MDKPNQNLDVDDSNKSLFIFGRDVGQMPCFRSTFLYGIGTGFGVGIGSFLFTSRPKLSTHIGFGAFFTTTLAYWFSCRYNWSKTKFEYAKLQLAMQQHAVYEGTQVEEDLKNKLNKKS